MLKIGKTKKIYEHSLQAERHLSREESKGTPTFQRKSKSKSKSNNSSIPMAGGNELAQLVKMMQKMQTRLDETGKKIKLMVTTLQTLIKSALKD